MAPLHVADEAGVEQARGVRQSDSPGGGQLHGSLVGLTSADDPGMLPHRNPAPLPRLDNFGAGLLDEASDPGKRLAAPIVELVDSRIDELGGRGFALAFL